MSFAALAAALLAHSARASDADPPLDPPRPAPPDAAPAEPGAADPAVRDAAARQEPGDPARVEALAAALAAETDEPVRLTMAVALVRAGDCRGLRALAALTTSEAPFLRLEADGRLRALAGAAAPVFDPIAGPDAAGAWEAWAAAQAAVPPGGDAVAWP